MTILGKKKKIPDVDLLVQNSHGVLVNVIRNQTDVMWALKLI